MKKIVALAAALSVPVALPATVTAHPAGVLGYGAETNWLIPSAGPGQENPESARTTGSNAGISKNMHVLAAMPKGELKNFNSDLAFWGKYAIMGNYDGLSVIDISAPESPEFVSETFCPGAQNDVSVYRNIIITSTDSQRSDDSCNSTTWSSSSGTEPWEGLRIWDWSNPANPQYVKSVATDCGSHTHTTIPDFENNRLIVYVSSYRPNNTPNCTTPHDKISVVEVPLSNPQQSRVIAEPELFNPGQASTSGCHDITAYPSKQIAAGACMGEGVILDISDLEAPQVISTVTDPNFTFWHSATFSNDADTVMFTDELGGGGRAECESTDPGNRGADGFYDISDLEAPEFKGYFKIQDFAKGRPQSSRENCVSHNGSVIPAKDGRDLMVQAWYQGGTSVIDFTDPSNAIEIAFFDRGPDTGRISGHWSSYWYNGKIYGSEIGRGFDVLNLSTATAQKGVKQSYFNPQTQEPLALKGR